MVKIKGDLSMFIYLAMIDSPEEKLKFELIYERYKNLMFYTANSVLGDTRDSEDVVHDAFIKIIEIIDDISDPNSPQTRCLIVTITENKAIDLYRKRKVKTVVPFEEEYLEQEGGDSYVQTGFKAVALSALRCYLHMCAFLSVYGS